MDLRGGIGKWGVVVSIALALAMCILSYIYKPVDLYRIEDGICLNSPDSWNLPPFLSWLLNTLLTGVLCISLYFINKSYNFIRTTEPVLVAVFVIMAASSPWFTERLNTSTLLCFANLSALAIIFNAYESKNATQSLFFLGAISSFGSMFQYAFIWMCVLYLVWAILMKVMRFKEFLAFILGLATPYWISLGFGFISINDFHWPVLVPLFNSIKDYSDVWILLGGIGLATILGLATFMINSMKLYAGNSRVNAMNLCVTLLGLWILICMLVDYENIPAYVITLYMCVAIQIANICAVWHFSYKWIVTVIPDSLFILLFIGSMLL